MRNSTYWRLSLFYFCQFAFVGAYAPFWSLYLESTALSPLQVGILLSLLSVTRIFVPNGWGWLADRTGQYNRIIQLSAILSLICYSGVLFSQHFLWLFYALLLMGVFFNAPLTLIEAITLAYLGKNSAHYGKIRLWGSIGFIITALLLGYALNTLTMQAVPWALLILLIVIALSAFLLPQTTPKPSPQGSVMYIIRQKEVLALLTACFLMATAHGAYYTFYTIYLMQHGYSQGLIGGLWSIGVVCEILIFLALPKLKTIFSSRQILLASFLLASSRFLMVGWGVELLLVLLLAQSLHAASFASYHASAITMLHEYFRGPYQARGQGLYTSVSYGAGGTLGAILAGYGWEHIPAPWVFTLAAAFAMLGFMVLFVWLKPHHVPASNAAPTIPA